MAPQAPGDFDDLIKSFERHLRAANRSPRTIEKYTLAARQLVTFMAEAGGPVRAAGQAQSVAGSRCSGMGSLPDSVCADGCAARNFADFVHSA